MEGPFPNPGNKMSARLTPDEGQFMVKEVSKQTRADPSRTSNPPHWSNSPQAGSEAANGQG